jgi:hypothetical protein
VQQLLLANGVIAAPGAVAQPGMCRAFPSMDEVRKMTCRASCPSCGTCTAGYCRPVPHPAEWPLTRSLSMGFNDLICRNVQA